MNNKYWEPKGYCLQDGCWNCDFVNHSEVASEIYPVCNAYHRRFMASPQGKCKRWKKDSRKEATNENIKNSFSREG